MTRRIATLLVIACLSLAGCEADLSGLQVMEVDELASRNARRADLTICDANNEKTRQRFGVIPGAVLLSSYRDYDPSAELPGDKDASVVFYCHSEMCGAAADAARKAVAAGYRDVWVLAPGIKGWAAAGQPVDAFARPGDAS